MEIKLRSTQSCNIVAKLVQPARLTMLYDEQSMLQRFKLGLIITQLINGNCETVERICIFATKT